MASTKRIKAYLGKWNVPEEITKALLAYVDFDADGEIPLEEFEILTHNAD
jgi:hypothetical protein